MKINLHEHLLVKYQPESLVLRSQGWVLITGAPETINLPLVPNKKLMVLGVQMFMNISAFDSFPLHTTYSSWNTDGLFATLEKIP